MKLWALFYAGWCFLLLVMLAHVPASQGAVREPVAMQLNQVRLVELARVVYGELLREDYIFDASFLAEPSEVTVDVRTLSNEDARALVVGSAQRAGFVVERVGKVWRFGREQLKAEIEPEVFFYRPKFRSVQYLADLLASMFPSGAFSFQRASVSGAGSFAMPGMFPQATGRPQAGAGSPQAQAGLAFAQQGPGGAQPMTASQGARSALAGGPYLPGVGTSSGGGVVNVDPKVDAFIFRGSARDVVRLRSLLEQVDRATGEVLVRAVVYEVRRSSSDASAITIAGSLLNGAVAVTYGTSALGNSLSVGFGGFRAVVSAFASDSRFKAVSSPSVRVQSGESARFTVGDETPVLGNVSYSQTGQAVQAVDYKPSGVILEIKPVVREDMVQLDVRQQLSTFAVTTSGVNNSPTLLKRELQTVLSLKPGEPIVIGGLEDARSSSDRTGLSFLPQWLSNRGSVDDRTEILLVLDVERIGGGH